MANNNNTPLNPITPLRRPWCQSVLPQVYDDALSYYEVLCGMGVKINEVITAQNNLQTAWEEYQTALNKAWETFRATINDQISDLQSAWSTYQTTLNQAWQTFQNVVNGHIAALTGDWTDYKNTLNTEWTTFRTSIDNIIDSYDTKWQDITSTWEGIETGWTSIQQDFAAMQTAWDTYQNTINDKIAELTSQLSGMGIDVYYTAAGRAELLQNPAIFANADTVIVYTLYGDIFIGHKGGTISTGSKLAWRQFESATDPPAVYTLISEPSVAGLFYPPQASVGIPAEELKTLPHGTHIKVNAELPLYVTDDIDLNDIVFEGDLTGNATIYFTSPTDNTISNFAAHGVGISDGTASVNTATAMCTLDTVNYSAIRTRGDITVKSCTNGGRVICLASASDTPYNVTVCDSDVDIILNTAGAVNKIEGYNSALDYATDTNPPITTRLSECTINPNTTASDTMIIDNCTVSGGTMITIPAQCNNVSVTNTNFTTTSSHTVITLNNVPRHLTLYGNTINGQQAQYSSYEIYRTGNVVNPLNQALIVGADLNLDDIITPGVYGVEAQKFYGTLLVTSVGDNTIMQIVFTLGANTGAKFRSYNTASQTFGAWYTLNGDFGSETTS